MDILTQGIAGALLAQVNAERNEKRLATGIGFFAGMLADADILIRSADDPLINLEFHRQFSHSLLFIPFGGLIAAVLVWWFVRKHLT
ncbi:MAG: metal-dependent hydrolase, partial [Gammaproteobacteria bacterium]